MPKSLHGENLTKFGINPRIGSQFGFMQIIYKTLSKQSIPENKFQTLKVH